MPSSASCFANYNEALFLPKMFVQCGGQVYIMQAGMMTILFVVRARFNVTRGIERAARRERDCLSRLLYDLSRFATMCNNVTQFLWYRYAQHHRQSADVPEKGPTTVQHVLGTVQGAGKVSRSDSGSVRRFPRGSITAAGRGGAWGGEGQKVFAQLACAVLA